jgi:DHA2 family multidrug resistance protein
MSGAAAPSSAAGGADPAAMPTGVRWVMITVSIMLATIMQAIDMTIANVALPHMQGSLSATQDQASWILTSYIVAAAIAIPPTGFLVGRLGRRRMFLICVGGFTTASVLCGISQSLEQMVFFRLLQGLFGAGLVPLSQSVLLDINPPEKHGSAMAAWGVGVVIGPIIGPTLGGWLTEYYDWRWVFFINLPFGLLALTGIAVFVPETLRIKRRFDFLGFGLLSLGIGALQLMLDRGESQDWFSSAEVVAEAVIAGLSIYLFIVHSMTYRRIGKQPFVDLAIFKDRTFCTGMVFIFLLGIVLLATMALLPPFMQNLMGYPVLDAGLVLAPRGLGTMIAMAVVGRLVGRVDTRLLILCGFGLVAVSLWQMASFSLDVSETGIAWTGLIQGLGLGLAFVPMTTMTFATLAPHLRTEGTSFYSLVRNLGSSIGISVVITRLSQGSQSYHAILAEHASPYAEAFRGGFVPPQWNPLRPEGLAALDQVVRQQATLMAYLDDFRLMAITTVLILPLLLVVRKPAQNQTAEAPHAALD